MIKMFYAKIYLSDTSLARSVCFRFRCCTAWALSGFLYALPNTVEGGKIDVIDGARVRVAPGQAVQKRIN